MANRTILELDTVSTSTATSGGLATIAFEVQISGLSAPESRRLMGDQVALLFASSAQSSATSGGLAASVATSGAKSAGLAASVAQSTAAS